MSATLSAVAICERSLRDIGAFPVTESAADGEQLREAMFRLDLIMAELAASTRLFNLIPQTLAFTLLNGTGSYALFTALGSQLPADLIQFPVEAMLLVPQGTSVVAFSAALPGALAVSQTVTDLTNPASIPPGAVISAIDTVNKKVTLSAPSTAAGNDILQFGTPTTPTNLVSTGTVGGTGLIAGTALYRRKVLPLVTRDEFNAIRKPADTGEPHIGYIDRTANPTLQVFPTPLATDPNLYMLRLDVQTYAPNVAPAGVTGTQPQGAVQHNFRVGWQRYLVAQLSHDLGSGAITKLPEASLNRFGKIAEGAKAELLAFENREHETTPPVGDAYDDHEYEYGGHYHRHHDTGNWC